MPDRLRIIALEEHVALPAIMEAWSRAGVPELPNLGFGDTPVARRLRDTAETRLAHMDDQGVDVAVLSIASPGVQNLPGPDAVAVARDTNDELAAIVAGDPARFQAFAAIPTQSPPAAAAELERAVTKLGLPGAMVYGRTGSKLADDPSYDELYAAAERLRVPLHFHPQMPVQGVVDAYYSGIGSLGPALAGPVIGWYYDLGVQYLRMIFSGVFDRYPGLQVIAGHWGEVVLFYLDHVGCFADAAGLDRPLADYFTRNFWIAGSGTVSPRYLRWTAEVVGTERMLYSTDYPFTYGFRPGGFPFVDTSGGVARSFLENAPFTGEQKADIAHRNWERLTSAAERRPAV
ncbi:amidohydrolase [Sphaerisporangium siamense]|uniref:Putative TIM-barrel fold metal-dependent hydrolase n=1 Tax=Sphaerisporangium siamense TaxID=795645 RepID=A0A7W7DBD3_9ACTN|nr:amidohydrolase family protein [Sphaerisporangium siamense]MBB4703707.1 putative TIM-barrel fold metal-dependent hydrolase [Sphaerisporangium siamense]GII82179.1 amidohydrolase [Sphaerisporangium siamense]